MTTGRVLAVLALGGAALCLCGRPANAYFERIFVSSRVASLGGAFVPVADDPGAVILNPAGLTNVFTASFLSSFVRPYDVEGLEEHYLASVVPTRVGTFGISWHRFGLAGVTSEDLITLAYGRDLIRTSQDASLSIGCSLDLARVSYEESYESKSVLTGSLGILLRPFPVIGLGYSIRNLTQPSFDILPGGGRTPLKMTHSFGVAYHWQRDVSVLYERSRGQDQKWRDRFGIEFRTGRQLRFRAGLDQGEITGGLGISVSRIVFDAAATAHTSLGVSYVVSLGYSLPLAQEATTW